MAYHTFIFFGYPIQLHLLGFIFCGTVCSYNFHWFLTPELASGSVKAAWSYRNRHLHASLFIASFMGAAYFGYFLIDKWYWLLLTAAVTFLYSAPKIPFGPFQQLKKIAIGKTVFLAFAWTHIPFILPLLFSTSEWTIPEYLFVFNRFYLIYAICIVFDHRDREADRKEGIRSMITDLPERGINRLFWGSIIAFAISAIAMLTYGYSWSAVFILLLPGIILGSTYRSSKSRISDYYYYFFLDGLMMLSSLLLLVF
ncbi:MAG: hypothetical protein JWP69_27 [Flaviaesturariibacter sp.]|nr:hypothetical protein [Flaviaesturariibacter sp.]